MKKVLTDINARQQWKRSACFQRILSFFTRETKREDLAHLSLRVNTSTKGNRTEIPRATMTKKGLGGLEVV
jgi:hypothetical protein